MATKPFCSGAFTWIDLTYGENVQRRRQSFAAGSMISGTVLPLRAGGEVGETVLAALRTQRVSYGRTEVVRRTLHQSKFDCNERIVVTVHDGASLARQLQPDLLQPELCTPFWILREFTAELNTRDSPAWFP